MNPAQAKLLRWLDSEWSKTQRTAGKPCDRAARLAFYQRLTGRVVTSSKDLRDADITKIKRHVLSLVQPDNLNVQIKSQEDEEAITTGLRTRIATAVGILTDNAPEAKAAAYAQAVCSRMFPCLSIDRADTQRLRKIAIELEQGAARKRRKAAATTPAAEDDGNPF